MSPSEVIERRIRYDEAFKAEAVRLWKTSNRAARIVAKELGISAATLYTWGREARPNGVLTAGGLLRGQRKSVTKNRAESSLFTTERCSTLLRS